MRCFDRRFENFFRRYGNFATVHYSNFVQPFDVFSLVVRSTANFRSTANVNVVIHPCIWRDRVVVRQLHNAGTAVNVHHVR